MPRGDGKKNHSTNKERSRIALAKARKAKHAARIFKSKQRQIKDQALAYWRGEDDYPSITGPGATKKICEQT